MGKIEATILHTLGNASGERMKAGDLDFYSLLRRQADEGRLFFNQRRAILFDVEAMGALRQQLIETLDLELAIGVLMRFGYTQGYRDAEILGENFEWATDTDWLAAGLTLHMLEGIVHVEPQKISFDRETGDFCMQGIWRNSYEAEEHLKHYGLAKQAVCWTLIGYASGYATRFFGRELLAFETQCMGKGDEYCHWEIRPVAEWGPEAEPYLKALQQINLTREIRETQQLQQRNENLLRTITNSTPDWIFIKDQEHRYHLVNQSYANALHLSPEEFIGKNDLELGFPEELVKGNPQKGIRGFWTDDRQVMDTGEPIVNPYDPATIDGAMHIFHTIKTPLRDEDGNVWGVLAFARDITELKQAEEANLAQAHLNAFTAAIGLALSQSVTLQEMLQHCAEVIVEHLGAAFARIWTLNPAEDILELQASAGMYTHIDGRHAHVPVGKFKIGLIAEERKPHLTNDVLHDPRVGDKKWAKQEGMVAFAGYPLIVEDRLVGVMAMFSRTSLQENVLQAMGAVANIIALSIDRKQAGEIVAKRAVELATVAEVSAAASTILETDKLLWEVANLTKERFGLYHAHIYLLDEAGDQLNLVAGAGEVGQKMVAEGWSIPLNQEQSLVAQAARTHQGTVVNDVRKHPGFLPNPLLPETRSEMALPMIVGDMILGVLDVQADRVNYFTAEDIFTKTILAGQIAGAVQNARLFEHVIQAQQEMAVVNKVLQEVSRQLDLEPLLETVYQQIQHIVPTDAFSVGLYNPSTGLINYPIIYDNNQRYVKAPAPILSGSNTEQVLKTGAPILINRTPQETTAIQLSSETALGDQSKPSASLVYVPLHLGQQTVGVMSVQSYQFNAYNERDLALLNNIANQVSVAVENIRLYKEAEARAHREQVLREVTTRVRNSVDIDMIMRTAAQEVGQALGRPAFIYLNSSAGDGQSSTTKEEACDE
jgi:PAS domain S-box-containing protein